MTDHAELIARAQRLAHYGGETAGTQLIDDLCDALVALAKEHADLEKQVYVPGMWQCAKCKCVVVSTNLHVDTGGFSANDEPQQCPNNCGPMWRRTERQAGNDLIDGMERVVEQKEQAERERGTEKARADAYQIEHGKVLGLWQACERERDEALRLLADADAVIWRIDRVSPELTAEALDHTDLEIQHHEALARHAARQPKGS